MIQLPEAKVRRAIGAIHRSPWLTLGAAVALAGAVVALLIFGKGIYISSRIQDLLPESAPSVKASEVLERRLGSADILVVTLMTDDFERVRAALPAIAAELAALPDIDRADYRLDVDLINRNALVVFPTLADLDDYYRELTDAIRDAVKKQLDLFGDDDDAPAAAPADGSAAPAPEEDVQRTFAWAEWEVDDALSEVGRTFRERSGAWREYFYNSDYTTIGLQLYPNRSSNDLEFCKTILAEVEAVLRSAVEKQLGPVGEGQIVTRIDLGGGYRNALQESNQVKSDMVSSALVSFLLLAGVIIVFFRSVRAFVAVFIPLVLGIVYTVGFVALTIGYLNLITAFIFAVLLGLAIDFGIHAYGRWREEVAAGHDAQEAMVITTLSVGGANLLAGATTALAFLSLALADFRGFSQFGVVAAVGVVLSLATVLVIFPAVIFLFERASPLKLLGYKVARDADGNAIKKRFPFGPRTLAFGVLLGVAGYAIAPLMVRMELDFNRLGPAEDAAQAEHQRIQHGTTQATAPAVIFTQSAEEARSIYQQIEARVHDAPGRYHPIIKSYQSLFSLVPEQQEEKAAQVKKICRKLARKVKLFEGDARDGADELLKHCDPTGFTVEELPDWVKAKFSDKAGRLGEFIFVSPRGSIKDGETALAFHQEMMTLRGGDGKPPVVSGKPMIWAEVILAMKTDGPLITVAALGTVLLLMLLYERKLVPVAMILLPLAVSLGITVGIMAIFDIKLNFFNMLMLPTVIGMGVDDGIHVYHRYLEVGRHSAGYVVRTTGMSAVLTTLTTSVGFGSLLTANHRGLNSLGLLTLIGMASALLVTLVVLPAAMQWADDRWQRKQRPAT